MAFKQVKLIATQDVKIAITYPASPRPVLAVYNYDLKVNNANPPIDHNKGDNQNSQDDIYFLPTPLNNNRGRFILVFSVISALEVDADFDVVIEIFQDGNVTDTLTDSGSVQVNGDTVTKIDMISFV